MFFRLQYSPLDKNMFVRLACQYAIFLDTVPSTDFPKSELIVLKYKNLTIYLLYQGWKWIQQFYTSKCSASAAAQRGTAKVAVMPNQALQHPRPSV
jgi:hypothetical protein